MQVTKVDRQTEKEHGQGWAFHQKIVKLGGTRSGPFNSKVSNFHPMTLTPPINLHISIQCMLGMVL